jgi:phage shock protein PspC (stress-responsive transcriptional regulator)
MNKVVTINLGGNAYQLEEGGYDALREYLETAAARLAASPDRDEILSDIERAIADKFRELLASHKTVVEAKEVAAVLMEMGPIEADADEAGARGADPAGEARPTGESRASAGIPPPRRLYRIHEGAMLAGVCNGIGAYVAVDPTLVRIGFVLLTIFWGTGLLVYVVMAIVVPEARSPEEKSAASGNPTTAQEFIRRAKEGYYEATKGFAGRRARWEWGRQFRRDMRANVNQWRHNWGSHWAQHVPVYPASPFALPVLSLLNGLAIILFMSTLISVLGTATVFGRPLPGGLPVWGAAVILCLVYGILTGPLQLARRACYRGMESPGWFGSFFFLLDVVIRLGVVAALVCLATIYFPEVRDALHSLPAIAHQAADEIQSWWHQK